MSPVRGRSYDSRPWTGSAVPHKVLAIRLQALGDVVITLPYLNDLKKRFPEMELHYLTLSENTQIPGNLVFIDRVFSLGGGRSVWLQLMHLLRLVPRLLAERYEVVLDLQNHWYSRWLLWFLAPKAWCRFDRHSPVSAGIRNLRAVESVFGQPIGLETTFRTRSRPEIPKQLLERRRSLVLLNPAGLWPSRQWPLENYVELIRLLEHKLPEPLFALVGLRERLNRAIQYFEDRVPGRIINVAGQTTPWEAFAIVGYARLVVTEDSGLMHMAWVQNIPTVALLGSTRSDWSSPLGLRSATFNSSDLPCGNCMKEICQHGDNRCLVRVRPETVLEACLRVLSQA